MVWADCSFDDSAAADIDAALKDEEEFMFSFWFKDLENRAFPPIFRFFSALVPLRLEMSYGRMSTTGNYYYVDIFDQAANTVFSVGSAIDTYRPVEWNSVKMG
jgi:hypothetical protein